MIPSRPQSIARRRALGHAERRTVESAVMIHQRLTWDPIKARANLRKHGIAFEEAAAMLGDPYGAAYRLTMPSEHPDEDRWITFGYHPYNLAVLLVVTWMERSDEVGPLTRIISARRATRQERWAYEAQTFRY